MAVKRPTLDQLRAVAEDLGMHFSPEDLKNYRELLEGNFAAYDVIDAIPDYLPATKYPRTPGYKPEGEENKYNAWYVKSTIKGAPSGKLAGKTVAIKDNVCVAGMPMMNGSSTLEGFTPDIDATIVTRILDAGGTILGKTHCELFCFSGGSHTNVTGPVHNPHKMGYSAGGSSSGSGVVVALGEADMAIGGDQGGSIRIPASWCGIYGMKPTHGLVPYTGVMPIEVTLDHTGPMTRTVADNALFLEVLAGADGLDPRQYAPRTADYTKALSGGVKGMRIGVVKEGFGHANSEKEVDAKVRAGAKILEGLGAVVEDVSIPMHLVAPAIWLPIAAEGATEFMMKGNGLGTNWRGLYATSLLDAHSAWKHRADELSDTLKITMLLGQYFTKHYHGHFYSKAQNLSRKLRAAYDAALAKYDLLLMPTLPMKATPLPPPDAPRALYIQRAFEMVTNTAPFDATGHPAMNLPCGLVDGLPVGLMLVGKHCEESTIYRAAAAFEGARDWKKI
ncbi:MAG TPA: amidase [Stellaceae bacterium]|nr:amidase [Stellaceae bacterium]